MEDKLKVRFAPAPTGFLHIGSARTALFNWLFAKKNNAWFVLRIEDSDFKRSKQEFIEEILDSLKWLGIDWDEQLYQSQRLKLYQEYANKLVDEGKAFVDGDATIFKYEFNSVEFEDIIRGPIKFTALPKDTEVLIKSDGRPTYNFACCLDDALLGITHVIRGEDHISNTPKQILIYKALGFKPPRFAHLPMILSHEGGKLSKRFGATSIREYKDKGYLAKAIVNYLLLLGWSPGNNREIISWEEAVKLFKLEKVNKTAAVFSYDKFNWVDAEYIKRQSPDLLVKLMEDYLGDKKFLPAGHDSNYLAKVVVLLKNRMNKLSDLIERGYCFFYDDFNYAADTGDILKKDLSKELAILKERLSKIGNFDTNNIEQEFRATAESLGLKARDLVHPVRVALTGNRVGPGLFETMGVLGKNKVLDRLHRLIKHWEKAGLNEAATYVC